MKNIPTFVWGAAVIVIVLWAGSFFAIKHLSSEAQMGLIGDSFGAINALFSGLAFVGLISTIVLQMKELDFTKEELKLTREELKKTAEAQIKSERALGKQVIQMAKAARLNALSSLVNHHSTIASAYGPIQNVHLISNEKSKALPYIALLKKEAGIDI